MATNYYYGKGCVSLAPVVNGTITGGFTEVGDADVLEVTSNSSFVDIREDKTGLNERVKHIESERDYNFTLRVKELSPDNLAIAFAGNSTDVPAATGLTVTRTAYGVNQPIGVGKIDISNVSVSVNGGVGGDLVLGTDYSVDLNHGSIKLLSTATHSDLSGFPAASVDLDIDFDHGAQKLADLNKNTLKDYAIRFESFNKAEDQYEVVILSNVTMHVASTLALINAENATLEMEGAVLSGDFQVLKKQN